MAGKRVYERHAAELPVTIVHEGQSFVGTTANLSLGGVFVNLAEGTLPFGASVVLGLRLPAVKEGFEIQATVRWSQGTGVGIQFGALRAIEVWALNQLFQGK